MHHPHTLARCALALATPLQLGLVTAIAAARYRQLPCCLMLQTLAFVAFNKVGHVHNKWSCTTMPQVCTAQYFVWYLSLLPLALPSLTISHHRVRDVLLSEPESEQQHTHTAACGGWVLVGCPTALAGVGVCS